jgi:fructose-bisphosphate aldolase class II
MHGVINIKPQPLAIDLVNRIREATKIPLVLHGASGVPVDELKQAISAGVHKLNADTDLRHAFRSGIEHTFSKGDRQLEEAMDEGRRRMIDATVEKMQDYGCAGKATA